MIKHIGICNTIDWNGLIKQLETTTPTYIGPSHKEGDPIPGLDEVTDIWKKAEFKTVHEGGNVGWDMFPRPNRRRGRRRVARVGRT